MRNKVINQLIDRKSGLIFEIFEVRVFLLDCEVSEVSHSCFVSFFCKVFDSVLHETYSCISRIAVNKVGSCTNNNHECTNIKLPTLYEARCIDILLNDNIAMLLNQLLKVLLLDTLFELGFLNESFDVLLHRLRLLICPLVFLVDQVLFELLNVRNHLYTLALITVRVLYHPKTLIL